MVFSNPVTQYLISMMGNYCGVKNLSCILGFHLHRVMVITNHTGELNHSETGMDPATVMQ